MIFIDIMFFILYVYVKIIKIIEICKPTDYSIYPYGAFNISELIDVRVILHCHLFISTIHKRDRIEQFADGFIK